MKGIKAGDLILAAVLAVLAVCLLFFFPKTQGAQVQIYCKGELYASYELSPALDVTLDVEGERFLSVIEITGEGARFLSSECPDKSCVHTGLVSRAGEMAACAPNRVLIVITGEAAYDAVVR